MHKLLEAIGGFTTVLDVVGAVLVVAGVAMVFAPAAYVVAGGFVLAISYQAARPPRRKDDDA